MDEGFSGRIKSIEEKLKGTASAEKKPKDLLRAIGKQISIISNKKLFLYMNDLCARYIHTVILNSIFKNKDYKNILKLTAYGR
jgi:hypothetical protein